ncbi:acyl-CoA desaturase [Nocardioides nanhaiensis]
MIDAPPTGAAAAPHLGPEDVEAIGERMDAIRAEVLESLGAADARYIRRLVRAHTLLEVGARVVLLGARSRPAWWVGTATLAVAKVLDNMEIGHNVLHGQWDWMRDPAISSTTWRWDHVSPPDQWQRSHNVRHHAFTNILGEDDDLGYGVMRVDEDQPWHPVHLLQPVWNLVTACIFEYGIALFDSRVGESLRTGEPLTAEQRTDLRALLLQARRQLLKDFVIHPLAAGPGWRSTLSANATACLLRNVWSHSVIMCGHFPEGVETFTRSALPQEETRGEWYVRQMLGSADISGPPLLHLMAGNLSHQIEHHLFPDLPSNHYARIAPTVRAVFDDHGLRYHVAPFHRQLASAWHKVLRLSLPGAGVSPRRWIPGRAGSR